MCSSSYHSSPSVLAAEAGGLVDGEDQRQGSAALDSVHQQAHLSLPLARAHRIGL
jgi:hypothetical protein